MASAEKRGSTLTGYWYGEVKHKTNGRFRKRFKTKDRAEAYEAHVKVFGEEPDWARDSEGETAGRTFKSVATELKAAGGPNGTWARERDQSVLQRLEYVCDHTKVGKAQIADVSYSMVEGELVEHLKKRPGLLKGEKLSPATVNRYLTAVSAVLTYAVKKHTAKDPYITAAPALPWQKVPKKRQHVYSVEQERAVCNALRAAGHKTEAFLVGVLAVGGLRAGELLGLKPEQIEHEIINLDDPEEIKNQETRLVYVGAETARDLKALVASGRMPDYQAFYRRLRAAIKTCGYDLPRPIHSLRHTAGTRTVSDETDIQFAKELLGHKNIKTTLGYRHISREMLVERAKKLHPQRGKLDENAPLPEVVEFKKPA